MAESKGLETEPLPKVVPALIAAEQEILVTDTVKALAVDSRLVGSYHTRQERGGIEILPDILRTLVDAQEKANPMARTVPEIAFCPP